MRKLKTFFVENGSLFIPRCKGPKFISALTERDQAIPGIKSLLNLAFVKEEQRENFSMNSMSTATG